MAGDWIKMRTDIYRDPKVCIMADLLIDDGGDLARYVNQHCQRDMTVTRNVMRNAVAGALVTIWGVMRHRGKRSGDDLVVPGASIAIIDDISELPGFGGAMESVGWIKSSESGLVFSNFFEEFNVEPGEEGKKNNAERQRRFREKRNALPAVTRNVTSNALRNVTVTSQSNAREEKRREEINTNTPASDDAAKSASEGRTRKRQDWHEKAFEAFWKVYPRRVGRAEADKSFEKAYRRFAKQQKTEERDAAKRIIEQATAYRDVQTGTDPQFICLPATWLNKDRYIDDQREGQASHKERPIADTSVKDLPMFVAESVRQRSGLNGGAI